MNTLFSIVLKEAAMIREQSASHPIVCYVLIWRKAVLLLMCGVHFPFHNQSRGVTL